MSRRKTLTPAGASRAAENGIAILVDALCRAPTRKDRALIMRRALFEMRALAPSPDVRLNLEAAGRRCFEVEHPGFRWTVPMGDVFPGLRERPQAHAEAQPPAWSKPKQASEAEAVG